MVTSQACRPGPGRGLPPPVTSWGFGAGLAGQPSRWGAGGPLPRGGGAESRAHGERGARGAALPLPRRGLRACPGAGRGGPGRGGRLGGCSRAARRALESRVPSSGAPRRPCLSFPVPGREARATAWSAPDSRKSASAGKRSFCSENSRRCSQAVDAFSGPDSQPAMTSPLFHFTKVQGSHSSRSKTYCWKEGKP